MNNIKVIAFDADDTLWVNETYFRDAKMSLQNYYQDTKPKIKFIKNYIKKKLIILRFTVMV